MVSLLLNYLMAINIEGKNREKKEVEKIDQGKD